MPDLMTWISENCDDPETLADLLEQARGTTVIDAAAVEAARKEESEKWRKIYVERFNSEPGAPVKSGASAADPETEADPASGFQNFNELTEYILKGGN